MSEAYMRGSTRGTIDRESNYGASGAINIYVPRGRADLCRNGVPHGMLSAMAPLD